MGMYDVVVVVVVIVGVIVVFSLQVKLMWLIFIRTTYTYCVSHCVSTVYCCVAREKRFANKSESQRHYLVSIK